MSALADRMPAERISPLLKEPREVTARDRLELLCDPGSLHVIRSTVLPRRESKRMQEGDGVVGAAGTIAGRPVYCYAQDASFAGGSLGEAHAETIVRVMQLAGRAGVPVIGFVASGGARMDDGIAALAGYGRIFRESVRLSGKVPQISVITGVSAGGGAYSPALTDFVVMTEGSAMFLTGPGVVREVTAEDVSIDELGGPRVHSKNGVCQFVAGNDHEAVGIVRELLAHLPQRAGRHPAARPSRAGARARPGGGRAQLAALGLRRARRDPGARGQRGAARGLAALGAQHGHRVLPDRRPPRGGYREPALVPGWCDRRRRGAEGGQVRALLQRLRPAARRARRHAGLPARDEAGGPRRDPPRREAAPRVRRGGRAEGDRRAAQGLRRRLHHDELEGPRRGPRARLARRPDRDHGRAAGRGDRPPARDRGRGRPGARAGPARRRVRGRARVGRHRGARGVRRRARHAGGHAPPALRARSPRCPARARTATAEGTSRCDVRRSRRQLHRRRRARSAPLAGRACQAAWRPIREPRRGGRDERAGGAASSSSARSSWRRTS